MFAGCEAVVEAFLIVDEKRRRLLRLERRQPDKFTALLLQRDLARDHGAHRQARFDLVEELLGKAHESYRVAACEPNLEMTGGAA